MQNITEGLAKISGPDTKKVSKEMVVFYNPVMKLNRDISVLLLNSFDKKELCLGLPLAGTGIRAIRFLKELNIEKIKCIGINDIDEKAFKLIKKNLVKNGFNKNNQITKHIYLFNKEANLFLIESKGFDYIDIDPFGSPNPFLDSAIKRLSRGGILAITATDTAPLCGTYPKTCKRKYWATPHRNYEMHEIGLRILIRKTQLIAAQYDRALTPIFSYSKDHYFRVFFNNVKGKKAVDEIIKQHGMYNNAGPLWLGQLFDKKLVLKMHKNNIEDKNQKFLETIVEESKIDSVGLINTSKIAKEIKLKQVPKKSSIIKTLIEKGFKASNTHFDDESIKTTADKDTFIKIIKSFKNN